MGAPVGREQFDADQQTEKTAQAEYIGLCDAFFQLQPILDLAAEDAVVQQGLTDIAAAKSRIPGQAKPPATA